MCLRVYGQVDANDESENVSERVNVLSLVVEVVINHHLTLRESLFFLFFF